jgi:hypothetical protein
MVRFCTPNAALSFSTPKIVRYVAIGKQCAEYIDFVLRVSAAEALESSNIELTSP